MKFVHQFYMAAGGAVCLWLAVAAFAGWKAPNLGFLDGGGGPGGYYSSGGRSSGGFWGGGK